MNKPVQDEVDFLTVGKLREILEGLDSDLPVILQSDAEGNRYRLAYGAEDGNYYDPESSWDGEVYRPDELEEYASEDAVPCFLLWPVN